jgi:hypothetical protein
MWPNATYLGVALPGERGGAHLRTELRGLQRRGVLHD